MPGPVLLLSAEGGRDLIHYRVQKMLTPEERAAAENFHTYTDRPMPRLSDDPEHPQKVLRSFIRWFLELLMVDGSGPLGKLIHHDACLVCQRMIRWQDR